MRDLTDEELLNLYDGVFDVRATDKTSKPGTAHIAALRAIYERGKKDGRLIPSP